MKASVIYSNKTDKVVEVVCDKCEAYVQVVVTQDDLLYADARGFVHKTVYCFNCEELFAAHIKVNP